MAPEVLAVCSSDNHLEQRPYVDYPEFTGDSFEAFDQVTRTAINLNVPLILAGDVLEKNYPDSITLDHLFCRLDGCKNAGVPVWFVEGQHDYAPKVPWLSLGNRARPLYPIGCARLGNYKVAGLGYTTATALPDAMKSVHPEADILVLHQPWREFMGEHLPSDGSLLELVPPHVRLVITGDFHVHKAAVFERPGLPPLHVLSPGSTTIQSVKEDPEKYFFILHSDLTYHSCKLRGRPAFKERLQTPSLLDEAIDRLVQQTEAWMASTDSAFLPEIVRKPLWIVYLHVTIGNQSERLKAAAAGRAHLFVRSFGQSSVASEDLPVRSCTDFAAAVEQSGVALNSSIGQAAMRLWGSQTPQAELESIVESWRATVGTNTGFGSIL